MKKYYSIVTLVFLGFLMMGMSSPVDHDVQTSDVKQKIVHHGSNYAKPHAGIELQYKLPKNIQADELIDIELVFTVRAQAEQLSVKVIYDDALQMNSQSEFAFDTTTHKKYSTSLSVMTLQEGRSLIDLSATILVNGKQQSRSFVIPLIIGDPTKSKFNTERVRNSDYKVDKVHGVVSMPALETSN